MSYIAGAEYAAGMMGAWSCSGIGKKKEELSLIHISEPTRP